MRVLVTGADGFLGANLCARLQSDGDEVTGAALNRKGRTSLDAMGVDIRVEYGDITDRAYVERIVNASEAEVIYHLAAVSIVRIAERDKGRALRTNVIGTVNVCEAAQGATVVVASSDKAYGDCGGAEYVEEQPLRPTGAYEVSKACTDLVAQLYGRHGRVIVTRCANLYGPGDLNWSRLVPNSCRRAVAFRPPEVHPSAWEYEREWVYVRDAVSAYIGLARCAESGAYNIGSGMCATAGDVAAHIAHIAGVPHPVHSGWNVGYEIPAQRLCVEKLNATLHWVPNTNLNAGLESTLAWYREYLS